VLGTDSIDFRIRRSSSAEADFLRSVISGSGLGVTYADLDAAPTVLLVGLEPEEESPIIFLRLRAATRRGALRVLTVAPFASPGSAKLSAHVLAAAPGQEAEVLRALAAGGGDAAAAIAAQGAIILVGERAAESPGALAGAVALAESTGARLAWVPRRAGDRGALEAGALPGLLPCGLPTPGLISWVWSPRWRPTGRRWPRRPRPPTVPTHPQPRQPPSVRGSER
jgi:NADH-quinone oxidoreductase subunit G